MKGREFFFVLHIGKPKQPITLEREGSNCIKRLYIPQDPGRQCITNFLCLHQRNESSPHPSINPPGTSKIAVHGFVETNTLGLGMLSHHSSDPQ